MSSSFLELIDWKRNVSDLYEEVRSASDPGAAWVRWRERRDELFAQHPQSPVPEADRGATSLSYFDYDAKVRAMADVVESDPQSYEIAASDSGTYTFTRFGLAVFELEGRNLELELYWLEGYGGGIFLPFRDSTSGKSTYGGGRYLLDTVKGADLGARDDRLVLDFNFAYNPSCVYDVRWSCPLSPPANHLPIAVEAGERTPSGRKRSS